MESVLDEVSRFCATQLQRYGECVDREGPHFGDRCLELKREVTRCASDNVSAVRAVKEKCSSQIEVYERCLQNNAADPSACAEQVRALYDCTHQ
ncbi:hypothetical protein DFJ73DRAFT_614881, partial [Zopfochytrium polystomum]